MRYPINQNSRRRVVWRSATHRSHNLSSGPARLARPVRNNTDPDSVRVPRSKITIPTKRLVSGQPVQTGPVADEKMTQLLELLPFFDLVPEAADKLLTSDLDPLRNF